MTPFRSRPTPPQTQPSTTNQQLRFRAPRGDNQSTIEPKSIRGKMNDRSGFDPAKDFKKYLARRQKELKRQAEMDAEQRQPLIDQRTAPNTSERTALIERENVADDTFPMQKGVYPDDKYLKQRGVYSNDRGGGGGARTESSVDMEKRRASQQVKKVTPEQQELGDLYAENIQKLKAKLKDKLDKKNNPDGQAEEIDMDALDQEIAQIEKDIEEQEKIYEDIFKNPEAEGDMFGGVKIDSADTVKGKTDLEKSIREDKAAREAAKSKAKAAEKYKAKQAKGGLDAGAEEEVVLEPISQPELETIPIQGEGAAESGAVEVGAKSGTVEVGGEGAAEVGAVEVGGEGVVEVGVVEGGATSIIGDIAATGAADITAAAIIGGEVAAGEAAAFIAGAAGANLLAGAALYGLIEGYNAIYDSVTTSDKEYSDQRNTELGSHEMDRREVKYKLQELGAARDIYEKKVNQGYSVSNKNPKAVAQHEADIAMLNALQTNIDSLNQSFKKDIPVYAVVENGFDVDMLDGDEKKSYDRLVERVSDAQDDVNYGGAASKAENQKRLDNRQRKLDTFISARSNASVATGFLNKPTDEEIEAIVDDYYENGTDAFGNLSSEQLEVLGITQAISDRREQQEIAGGNFDVSEVTDEEALAYWEEEKRQWAAEDAAERAKENDESGKDYDAKRAAYFSDHPEEVAAMENQQQETAEPSHQDDARGLTQTEETE
jgi:hypothetical protein